MSSVAAFNPPLSAKKKGEHDYLFIVAIEVTEDDTSLHVIHNGKFTLLKSSDVEEVEPGTLAVLTAPA